MPKGVNSLKSSFLRCFLPQLTNPLTESEGNISFLVAFMTFEIVRVAQNFLPLGKAYGHFVSISKISILQKELGHRVLVVCPGNKSGIEVVQGVNVLRIRTKRPLSFIPFQIELSRFLEKYYSDKQKVIIHSHGRTAIFLSYKKRRPPHVVHMHGLPYGAFKEFRKISPSSLYGLLYNSFVHNLYRIALRKADKVISFSKDITPIMSKAYGVERDKLVTIYNGVDESFLGFTERLKEDDEREITEGKSILFVGRLKWIKGIYHLIYALPKVVQLHPTATLVIVGGGENNRDLNVIKKLVNSLKLGKHVRMIGHVPYHKLPAYYSASKVHVATSLMPGIPKTVFESLACGTPVIASRNVDNTEIVLNNHCGLLVNPTNPDEIAEKISYLLSNPDECRKMGRRGREVVKSNFTWRHTVERIVDVYKSLFNF